MRDDHLRSLIRILSEPRAMEAFFRDAEVLRASPRIKEILERIATTLRSNNVFRVSLELPPLLDGLAKEFPQFFDWAAARIDAIVREAIKKGAPISGGALTRR